MDPMNSTNTQEEQPEQIEMPVASSDAKKMGPIMGAIIIVAVIAFGGYYIWKAELNHRNDMRQEQADTAPATDQTLTELGTQSNSDSLSTIEGDINTTELDAIDQELADLEAELETSGF